MEFNRLVVNGCGYVVSYVNGNGHIELANKLNIKNSHSLAMNNSSNSRIIRTTLKDSFTKDKTLYVIGLTFLGRNELPIAKKTHMHEGTWISFQNKKSFKNVETILTDLELQTLIDLKLKIEKESINQRLEDLVYKLLALIDSVKSRGHNIIIFNENDDLIKSFIDNVDIINNIHQLHFIDKLKWKMIEFQYQHGSKISLIDINDNTLPDSMKHPEPGIHAELNNFLLEKIQQIYAK